MEQKLKERAALSRLEWKVFRPLARALGGQARSTLRGPGAELDELRPYTPGDDVRHIDWNITARAGEPYIRQAKVERALDVWLALDVSPSLAWGTARSTKAELATDAALAAGRLLGRAGNRVGALLFAERPLGYIPPGRGRPHELRLHAGIVDAPGHARQGATDLARALVQLDKIARRPAVVVVISDFLVANGWEGPLRRVSQRHEVTAIRVTDPRERTLPDVGILPLEDPETGAQLWVDTTDRKLRERYAAAVAEQDAQIVHGIRSAGAELLALSTEAELLPALVRFLSARRRVVTR